MLGVWTGMGGNSGGHGSYITSSSSSSSRASSRSSRRSGSRICLVRKKMMTKTINVKMMTIIIIMTGWLGCSEGCCKVGWGWGGCLGKNWIVYGLGWVRK